MKNRNAISRFFTSFHNDMTMPGTLPRDIFLIVQGSLVQAAGYTIFLIPNKIIPGGLYGIGTVLYHLFSLPVGTVVFFMNLPLILWGIRVLGNRFGIRTIVGIVLTSAFTDIIIYLFGIPKLTDDLMVQAIIGGVLVGYGVSLIFKTGATTGGVEIVAQILTTSFGFSPGRSILAMNVCIIAAGVFFLGDMTMVIYSVVAVYAISKVMDASLEGVSFYKGVIVVSDKHEEIRERVEDHIGRGVYTLLGNGSGAGQVLFTALTRREVVFLKEHVMAVDSNALVIVFNAQEFAGNNVIPEKKGQ